MTAAPRRETELDPFYDALGLGPRHTPASSLEALMPTPGAVAPSEGDALETAGDTPAADNETSRMSDLEALEALLTEFEGGKAQAQAEAEPEPEPETTAAPVAEVEAVEPALAVEPAPEAAAVADELGVARFADPQGPSAAHAGGLLAVLFDAARSETIQAAAAEMGCAPEDVVVTAIDWYLDALAAEHGDG